MHIQISQVRILASTSAKFSTNGDETDYRVRGEGFANLEHKSMVANKV
jgi:hypothetical protein